MAVGIIDRSADVAGRPRKVAFSRRRKAGACVLKLLPEISSAERSAADLYNKLDGEARKVDVFYRELLPKLKLNVPLLVGVEMFRI